MPLKSGKPICLENPKMMRKSGKTIRLENPKMLRKSGKIIYLKNPGFEPDPVPDHLPATQCSHPMLYTGKNELAILKFVYRERSNAIFEFIYWKKRELVILKFFLVSYLYFTIKHYFFK